MERLEAKRINGNTYYYYAKWGKVNGKSRRLWQKYLGKPDKIAEAVLGGGLPPRHAEVFQWGLSEALWKEAVRAEVVEAIDRHCPKRTQALTVGQYLTLAAMNRATDAQSKRAFWDWFSQTTLMRHFPHATASRLNSQQFWNHMDRVSHESCHRIWQSILQGVVARENLSLDSICYDGTNFYTFIDTFNVRCDLAKRGKNKQGRSNLRQVSYALFCCADGPLPLFYDVYEGSRNDAKQFPRMLKAFHAFLRQVSGESTPLPQTTLVFDKGNNSKENFALVDELKVKFVGSVKLDEHKDLAEIPNDDPRLTPCPSARLERTKAYRTQKTIYGRKRVAVVTYNQNLFESQYRTVQHDLSKALEKLSALQQRLEDRRAGILRGGRAPTAASVKKQCDQALSRQHLKKLVPFEVASDASGLPALSYRLDNDAFHHLCNTLLGKNILVTNQDDWAVERIITAYRSQFLIEDVFKQMKDRRLGSWWPQFHWTDAKIRVHAFYCTLATLLRGLLLRRVERAGIKISLKRLFRELEGIREVINVYDRNRGKGTARRQTVLTKTNEIQDQILSALDLTRPEKRGLG